MDFNSYIGRQTRVVSKQNVRYSGTMQFIDPVAQKIRVTNVRCFGTEDRPADVFMPPLEHPFNLVEFNVADLNDLKFEDAIPASTSTPPSAPGGGHPNAPAPTAPASLQQQSQPQQTPMQPTHVTSFSAERAKPPGAVYNANPSSMAPQQQQTNASTATGQPSSSDTLQRAMDAMTLNNSPGPRSNGVSPAPATNAQPGGGHNARGRGQGRRGRGAGRTNGYQQGRDHHRQPHHIENKVPSTDFDFQASNQKFDKGAAARQHSLLAGTITDSTSGTLSSSDAPQVVTPSASGDGARAVEDGEIKDGQTYNAKGGAEEKVVYNPSKSFFDNISDNAKGGADEKVVYNPSKSFFDNISSDANSKKPAPRPPGERGGGPRNGGEPGAGHSGRGRGRGGGYGRSRRDEEREKNVATFGEPGGVGLLGPGAYVGGYGGYRGRRRRGGQGGGGRGARGAAGGGAPRVAAV